MALLALQAAFLGACVAILAVRSVRHVSQGGDSLGWGWALLPATVGALALPLAFAAPAFTLEGLMLAALGALLLGMAAADRQTAWAPDAMMVPLCLVAGAYCAFRFDTMIILGMAGGLCLWAVVSAIWIVTTERFPAVPPPPDILAFSMGPILFGFGIHGALAILMATIVLSFIRFVPASLCVFGNADAARQAGDDLGYEEHHGLAVPLLGILFPIYAVALTAKGFYPQLLSF